MADVAKLTRIVNLLDPAAIDEKISNRVMMAARSYPLKKNSVKDFEELLHHSKGFAKHVWDRYLGVEWDEEYAYQQMVAVMNNGRIRLQDRYDACRRGTNGGVKALLDDIVEAFIEEQTRNYVHAVFDQEIGDRLDSEIIRDVMEAYLVKFGQYLPFAQRNVESLMLNWEQILLNHAKILATIRSQVGRY